MKRTFSQLHRGLALLVLVMVVSQFLLAGIGVFGAGSLDLHRIVGGLTILGGLLLALFALLAGAGRRVVGGSALFLALAILQMMLIWFGDVSRFIPALHPLNAVFLLGVSYALARGSLRAELPAAEEHAQKLGESFSA